MRELPCPSRVTSPPPSITVSRFHGATTSSSIGITTGSDPQSKVTSPDADTASCSASRVHPPGLPEPTTREPLMP
ncbi:MAG: hypothetical protein JJ863_20405 [Deltaproteobacteria bacterium]|nr:hypothetical protein [Deltaproteobacteria bacterium]